MAFVATKTPNKTTPKTTVATATAPARNRMRSSLSFMAFSAALFFIITANISFWVSRTMLNTDDFVKTTGPLIQQPAVQKQVSKVFAEQLIKAANPEEIAQKLGTTIPGITAANAQQKITDSVATTLSSKAFQDTWQQTIEEAHSKAVALLKDDSPNPTIDFRPLLTNVQNTLKTTQLAPVADLQLPADAGVVKFKDNAQLRNVQSRVKQAQQGIMITAGLILLLMLAGTLLAMNRLKALGTFLVIVSAVMFLAVLIFAQGGSILIGKVGKDSADAANAVFVVLRGPLVTQSLIIATVSGIAGVALLVGRRFLPKH